MALTLRSGLRSAAIGALAAVIVVGIPAAWRAASVRDAVCRVAVSDIMDFGPGKGRIDPDSGTSWLDASDVDLLVVADDSTTVHSARCGFSTGSLLLRPPVLQSLAIDDLLVSPIRLKLLGIALGIGAEPVILAQKTGS